MSGKGKEKEEDPTKHDEIGEVKTLDEEDINLLKNIVALVFLCLSG